MRFWLDIPRELVWDKKSHIESGSSPIYLKFKKPNSKQKNIGQLSYVVYEQKNDSYSIGFDLDEETMLQLLQDNKGH
jgi:hypothetical protein